MSKSDQDLLIKHIQGSSRSKPRWQSESGLAQQVNWRQVDGSNKHLKPQHIGKTAPNLPPAALVSKLEGILLNVKQYRVLLQCDCHDAQKLLDMFQWLLDTSLLDLTFRRHLIVATQRISKKTGLYPVCYELKGVTDITQHPVASGGFADIYRGKFQGQNVCIKAIRVYEATEHEDVLKHLSKEAILWGQLLHLNVLPIYGLYRFRNQLCLVAPWMSQGDITKYLKRNPKAPRRRLADDVANGLQYLHQKGIIHGDLKGANILVDDTGTAGVADFGISSISDPVIVAWTSHSSAASKGGSVRWQAPELFDMEHDQLVKNSAASDVYAWAGVCYEIFTGTVPFFSMTRDPAIMLQIKQGARPTRPANSSPSWSEWGLTDSIWLLMQDCWKENPLGRPTIEQAIDRLHPERDQNRERLSGNVLSPACFREKMVESLDAATISTLERILGAIASGDELNPVLAMEERESNILVKRPRKKPLFAVGFFSDELSTIESRSSSLSGQEDIGDVSNVSSMANGMEIPIADQPFSDSSTFPSRLCPPRQTTTSQGQHKHEAKTDVQGKIGTMGKTGQRFSRVSPKSANFEVSSFAPTIWPEIPAPSQVAMRYKRSEMDILEDELDDTAGPSESNTGQDGSTPGAIEEAALMATRSLDMDMFAKKPVPSLEDLWAKRSNSTGLLSPLMRSGQQLILPNHTCKRGYSSGDIGISQGDWRRGESGGPMRRKGYIEVELGWPAIMTGAVCGRDEIKGVQVDGEAAEARNFGNVMANASGSSSEMHSACSIHGKQSMHRVTSPGLRLSKSTTAIPVASQIQAESFTPRSRAPSDTTVVLHTSAMKNNHYPRLEGHTSMECGANAWYTVKRWPTAQQKRHNHNEITISECGAAERLKALSQMVPRRTAIINGWKEECGKR